MHYGNIPVEGWLERTEWYKSVLEKLIRSNTDMEQEKENMQSRENVQPGGGKRSKESRHSEEIEQNTGFPGDMQSLEMEEACCHHKVSPRPEREVQLLKNRLNRMVGQLNGISRMLDENRYCGDILIQISAVESALQSFGYLVLKDHMETCVAEEIRKGNQDIIAETVELVKKLK